MTGRTTHSGAGRRRTQEERREATRTAFLEATLTCLGRQGYAGTSIGEVVKEAGLSRGALSHHYPTKLDLAAAAITYFYEQRLERLQARLIPESGKTLTLHQRLAIFKEDIDAWSPVGFEILVAIRTNPDLYREYIRRVEPRSGAMVETYERMFPEFGKLESPELMVGVVGAFLRGLSMENANSPRERIDSMFELFVKMLSRSL